ncbi:3-hydroxybenzoate 6-hydroxylase [Colletotrichum sidae]|uniref:3-hydroxybenzoate 6-hydroxylase n=1 Tax=Colletotrichum sidae TaxID=1347389 RepID=A0A4R8T7E2_9PEZI|nr:3-hydroxybenzoate 6-hydroxylase [Colletotrichum sidae]
MGSMPAAGWRQLNVGVVGGGIGGMSVAIALRRAGHHITIYERNDFAGEVGASVSCAANGSRWLHQWDVEVEKGDPVILKKLINRDWATGEPVSVYDLGDYKKKWNYEYYMFHRQYMHSMLRDSAIGEKGEGAPAKLLVNHKCKSMDLATGRIEFENGFAATHDLIIGADGIGSVVRRLIGVNPEKKPADSSCLHANVLTETAVKAGLVDYSQNSALEYWGGQQGDAGSSKWNKIVLSPCNGGKLLSYYCFFAREKGDYTNQAWGAEDLPVQELLDKFPQLDEQVRAHLAIGIEVQPWRLWVHQPYPYLNKNMACLLGDAGHPMMPHQSQGACMAIEDAAALGILFHPDYFNGDVNETLAIYNDVRLPRATRVQSAAAKAAYNINERIGKSANRPHDSRPVLLTSAPGFSSNADSCSTYKVEDEKAKLTIEEMNAYDMYKDIEEAIAKKSGSPFSQKFIKGLPIGLELPNGVVIGQ